MEHLLNSKQIESVREGYRTHPLLLTCSKVFKPRMGILGLKAQPEDVFCLVADVLDDIIDTTMPTQEYIDELWTSILLDIQQWSSRASIPDRMLTAGTVFYIVRELLGYHWDSRYNDAVYYMMSDTLESRLKVEDKKEEELFLQSMSDCSSLMSAWMNNYDTRYGFLSEEIEDVVVGRKHKKVEEVEPEEDNSVILTSFTYLPKRMDISERNRRLTRFFEALAENGQFIYPPKTSAQQESFTDQQDFLNTFIGIDTDKKIVWTNETKRLSYLIHKLKERNLISWTSKPRKGINQMICARFLLRKKVYDIVEGQLKKTWHWEECEISPSELNTSLNEKDEDLDKIIDILDVSKKESIETGVAGLFYDAQKDALSEDEQEQEGFHPTDHQSYMES